MTKRLSRMGWIVLAILLSLTLVVLPACSSAVEYELTIAATTGGTTTPAPGPHVYTSVQVVNLKAIPDEGYEFVGWTGETSTVTDVSAATTTINMDGDYFITANFQQTVVPTSVLKDPQGYPADPSVKPLYGGTLLVLHSGSGPSNIGAPWTPGGVGRDGPMGRFAVERLVGMDENFDLAPQLAEDWDEDANARTITFYLREGVKFHDGTDFNAQAVKWCLEKYRDTPGGNTELDDCTAVDVMDPYTVKLTFSTWNPNLLRNFASTSCGLIVSPTWAQAHTEAECKLHPVGTGPFEFKSYTANDLLEYVAFDDYWQDGLPYLDGVQIDFVADPVVRLTAFLNEQGDVMNEVLTHDAKNLQDQGYEVISRLVHLKGIAWDIKNTDSPFYGENGQKVREAMAHAIPNAQLVADVFDNMYAYTNQLAMPNGAAGVAHWTAYDPTIVGYSYDPDLARQLMEEAGYSATNRLSVKLTYSDTAFTDFYTAVQSYLDDVYIDITPVYNIGYRGYIANQWEKGTMVEYQFSYNGFELYYDQSLTMALSAGQAKYKLVVTPTAFNTLYDSMMAEMNLAAREDMYKELNKMAIDDYCLVLPQFGMEVFHARQPWVHDFGYGVAAQEYCPEKAFMSEQ